MNKTISPQLKSKSQGNTVAGVFAGLVCLLDALLLLGVAVMQIAGGGIGVLVGFLNLGVTVAYLVVARGLFARSTWSYGAGMSLGLLNFGFVCFQMRIMLALAITPEEISVIPLFLMAGDVVLVIALFVTKNAMIPPLLPMEVPVPSTLLTEMNNALEQGQISSEEKDLFIATYRTFVAKLSGNRTFQIEVGVELGAERVDIKVYRMLFALMSRGDTKDSINYYLYLFRPIVDNNVREWMNQTVWKSLSCQTAIICIHASKQACASAGSKPFSSTVGIYALRGNKKTKGGGEAIKNFVKFFRQMLMYYGELPQDFSVSRLDKPAIEDEVVPSQKGLNFETSSFIQNRQAEELLKQGVAALRAGHKVEAHNLLKQVVEINPHSEKGWLWLSGAVDTDEERRFCMNQILSINPDNVQAQRGLSTLGIGVMRSPLDGRSGLPKPLSQKAITNPFANSLCPRCRTPQSRYATYCDRCGTPLSLSIQVEPAISPIASKQTQPLRPIQNQPAISNIGSKDESKASNGKPIAKGWGSYIPQILFSILLFIIAAGFTLFIMYELITLSLTDIIPILMLSMGVIWAIPIGFIFYVRRKRDYNLRRASKKAQEVETQPSQFVSTQNSRQTSDNFTGSLAFQDKNRQKGGCGSYFWGLLIVVILAGFIFYFLNIPQYNIIGTWEQEYDTYHFYPGGTVVLDYCVPMISRCAARGSMQGTYRFIDNNNLQMSFPFPLGQMGGEIYINGNEMTFRNVPFERTTRSP